MAHTITTERELEREAMLEIRAELVERFGAGGPVVQLLDSTIDATDPDLRAAALAAGRRRLGRPPCDICRRRPPELVVRPDEVHRYVDDPLIDLLVAANRKGHRLGFLDASNLRLALVRTADGWRFHHHEGVRWLRHGVLDWLGRDH